MVDGSGLAEAMLGRDGVRVMGECEADGEVTIEVETIESRAWCGAPQPDESAPQGGPPATSSSTLTRCAAQTFLRSTCS